MGNGLEQKVDNAKKIAIRSEIANLTKSSFLAYLSHEFRTPMNSVMGMLRLLSDSKLDEKQQEYVESARSACRTMLSLVRNTTNFSSKEMRNLQIEKAPFNICQAGKDVVKLLSGNAGVKKIQLKYEFVKDTPSFVIGDMMLFKQVVAKLVQNSIDVTDKGSVRLIIDCSNKEANIATIRAKVIDTAHYLTEDEIENIFDFTSENHDDGEALKSLDISVCKFILESMGGGLTLESIEGVGSLYTITVPCEMASATLSAKQSEKEDEPEIRPKSYTDICQGLKVLVAEDDPINKSLAVAFITRLGGTVDTAANGQEAIDKFITDKYDLVFMDCEMPVMDGYDATVEIRKHEGNDKHTPILAMTAYAAQGDRDRCISAGMDDHIPKPVTVDILQKVVEKFIVPDSI